MTDTTESRTSPIWHSINADGDYWHCEGHMCMSPLWQMSWDGFYVCNGCLGKYTGPMGNFVPVVSCTVQVTPNDIARDLTVEEVGYNAG